ncbi:hypothetical protein QJS10_CPA06g01124 [Acorus calamus]|uniref:Thioredoxin domain-containing protein n=1 Tax=Acorus calamus TaxID=4465 RepID=A0AAV9ET80_ACOCL|nr:hypothetical protein QJS10_CPA06g01124 [Acorus calamus]
MAALQITLSSCTPSSTMRALSSSLSSSLSCSRSLVPCNNKSCPSGVVLRGSRSLEKKTTGSGALVVWCSSMETTTVEVEVGKVTEVNKDTFWPIVKAAGSKVVVLDMYTQWCGPCKVIAPRYKELSEKHLDIVFLKLDCNQENKALAKELGIRVVPTFKILKDNKVVKEVTGAKFDDLVLAIETVNSS